MSNQSIFTIAYYYWTALTPTWLCAFDLTVLPHRSGYDPDRKIYHVAFLVSMRFIPLYTLVKGDTSATKDIQSTANSQINLALAAGMNLLQILETSCTPRVRNRDCAPLSQFGHQILVNALL